MGTSEALAETGRRAGWTDDSGAPVVVGEVGKSISLRRVMITLDRLTTSASS